MRARGAWALAALAALPSLSGCATLFGLGLRPPDAGRVCAGPLVPSQQLPQDLLLRAQVQLRAPGGDWKLTLVARTRDGALTLVGLDGFGARLFALTQRGVELSLERSFGRALPWPPQNLLRDLHAIRFLALPGAPLPEGTHRGRVADAPIEERWVAGRLAQRAVASPGGGARAIEWRSDGRGLELENAGCGYAASYLVLEERGPGPPLGGPGPRITSRLRPGRSRRG